MNKLQLINCMMFLVVLCACNGSKTKQWTMERDSLIAINTSQRQVLDDMTSAVVEISNILDTINIQEGILFSQYDEDGRKYTRSQVVNNLKTFENILIEKRKRIDYLDSLMNKSDERMQRLSSLVNYLNKELDKKDSIIKVLKTDIQSKNYSIKTLNEKITSINANMEQLSDSLTVVADKSSEMEKIIKEQEGKLYAVYYIIGTKKELASKGVIEGGNWFKKAKVNQSAISLAQMADSRELSFVLIQGNKPNILTDMPTDSYNLVKMSDGNYKLEILDKTRFWSANKLLVIQIK